MGVVWDSMGGWGSQVLGDPWRNPLNFSKNEPLKANEYIYINTYIVDDSSLVVDFFAYSRNAPSNKRISIGIDMPTQGGSSSARITSIYKP